MAVPVFVHSRSVLAEEIDRLGHVNNLVYLRWALDAAVKHSDHNGWNFDRYQIISSAWVVRSHQITYLRPAMLGDQIEVVTGIVELSRVTCQRHYLIERVDPAGRTRLAEASTDWVFIDTQKGSPRRIPPEVIDAFPLVDVEKIQLRGAES
jgi:acyl-CoA thioester hydrolase